MGTKGILLVFVENSTFRIIFILLNDLVLFVFLKEPKLTLHVKHYPHHQHVFVTCVADWLWFEPVRNDGF